MVVNAQGTHDPQAKEQKSKAQKDIRALSRTETWTSLAVQWLRIRLTMQGTWVQSPVQEDLTCLRAIKPTLHNRRSHCSEKPVTTTKSSPQSLQLEKWPQKSNSYQAEPKTDKYINNEESER